MRRQTIYQFDAAKIRAYCYKAVTARLQFCDDIATELLSGYVW